MEDRGEVREVDFDRLPLAARERLVACLRGKDEPRPLVVDAAPLPFGVADAAVAGAGLGIVGVVAARGFGEAPQGVQTAALYALGALLVAVGGLELAARARARGALPFPDGRYLFPRLFLDARSPRLRVAWLGGDHALLSRDDAATLDVFLPDQRTERFVGSLGPLQRASTGLKDALAAVAEDRVDDPAALDPLFDVRRDHGAERPAAADGPLARPTPALLRPGARAIAAPALAAALAVALFFGRERLSDDAAFARARADGSLDALEAYATRGGRHVDETRATLLPAARKAAAHAALADLHGRYAAALAGFEGRAATGEARLVPVVKKLLEALERRADPRVPLSFRAPTAAVLEAVDNIMTERAGAGPPVVPVTPHFLGARTKPYEPAAARGVAAAFAEAFPPDLVRVEPGEAADDQPSIEVGYLVGWGGDVVVDEPGNRRFVSVVVDFDVTLHVPGEAALSLRFRVLPPADLEVKVDADAATATSEQVYGAMATHAFSEVGPRVRAALYRSPPP